MVREWVLLLLDLQFVLSVSRKCEKSEDELSVGSNSGQMVSANSSPRADNSSEFDRIPSHSHQRAASWDRYYRLSFIFWA